MYCKYCGKEIDDESTFCEYCGKNVEDGESSNSFDLENRVDGSSMGYDYNTQVVNDHVGIGWVILAFFIPIAGLIEYFVFKNEKPKQAKYCGIAALVSFIINLITLI